MVVCRISALGPEEVACIGSEMPFMLRAFPSEAEQHIMYRQLLNTFYPRRVVMRTLDVGGDKQLPPFSAEENCTRVGVVFALRWITLMFFNATSCRAKASVELNIDYVSDDWVAF